MNLFRFSKGFTLFFRLIFTLLFLGLQVAFPLNGNLGDVQAAPAPDLEPAPVMETGDARPSALTVQAEMNKSFDPIAIVSGATSTLRVTVYNLNANPLTDVTWADNMPAGMTIADPLNVSHNCDIGAVITDSAGGPLEVGDTSFKLASGTVPEQDITSGVPGSCYVEVDVTSRSSGNLINTIDAGELSSL